MIKSFLTVTLSAGALALGGAALAQQSPDPYGPGGSAPGTMEQRQAPPAGDTGASAVKPEAPTADLVGKDLVDPAGEKLGEVERVEGNTLVVSSGGFLGIGERHVAVSWDQIAMVEAGEETRLVANLTREQIRAMPDTREGRN